MKTIICMMPIAIMLAGCSELTKLGDSEISATHKQTWVLQEQNRLLERQNRILERIAIALEP